jgi:hypothetical protein
MRSLAQVHVPLSVPQAHVGLQWRIAVWPMSKHTTVPCPPRLCLGFLGPSRMSCMSHLIQVPSHLTHLLTTLRPYGHVAVLHHLAATCFLLGSWQ